MRSRRWLALLCCAGMLLGAAACGNGSGNPVSPGDTGKPGNAVTSDKAEEAAPPVKLGSRYFTFTQYSPTTYEPYMVDYGTVIECTAETAKAYPALADALSQEAEQLIVSYEKLSQLDKDEKKALLKGEFGGRYTYTYETHIRRADAKAVSLVSFVYSYMGGAHPHYAYVASNYHTQTGQKIRLSEVISPEQQTQLNELLLQKLRENDPDMVFFDEEAPLGSYRVDWKPGDEEGQGYIFSLDSDGICFYFDPYALGPFSNGLQTVKILYAEQPSLFAEDYAVKGAYAAGMGTEALFDLGSDGTVDSLGIELTGEGEAPYDYYTRITVFRNGRKVSTDLYCNGAEAVLMHTDDNRDYLYVISHEDNDGSELMIFDMNGKKPSVLSATGYGLPILSEEEHFGYLQMTDSKAFALDIRCDLLASFRAQFDSAVGADGRPVLPADGWYDVPDYVSTLKSAKAFKADIVNEKGEVTEKDVLLPKGETFRLLRTDAETKLDAQLSDGRIARLELVRDEDSFTGIVNGQLSENEAFEVLYYAG